MDRLAIAKQLIAIDSTSGSTGQLEAANLVSDVCTDLGFTVSQFPYHSENGESTNVVAVRGGSEAVLALSGHLDTVKVNSERTPAGNRYPGWNTNPFALTHKDGRIYGRGVADMKLFLAIAIEAAAGVSLRRLANPVALYFTTNEEIGCVGAKNLLTQKGFTVAPNVVIGEPTEMKPAFLHKGYAYFRIKVSSTSSNPRRAHSSDDRTCTNLVEDVLPEVLAVIRDFKRQLRDFTDSRFTDPSSPGYPTLNTGNMLMPNSAAKNVIPTEVTLECDLRPIPGQDSAEILKLLQRQLQNRVDRIRGLPGEIFSIDITPARTPTPPMQTPTDSFLCQTLHQLTGNRPIDVSFNTEGGLFRQAGANTIVCGPGSIAQAHVDNEFVDQKWLSDDVLDVYRRLIARFCLRGALS